MDLDSLISLSYAQLNPSNHTSPTSQAMWTVLLLWPFLHWKCIDKKYRNCDAFLEYIIIIYLLNYYIAAQIKAILAWMNDNHCAKWRKIEILQMDKSLNELLFTRLYNTIPANIEKIFISNTIRAWMNIAWTDQLQKDRMYLKEIAKDGNFKPNMLDDTFKI